jgi:hypothetical protein
MKLTLSRKMILTVDQMETVDEMVETRVLVVLATDPSVLHANEQEEVVAYDLLSSRAQGYRCRSPHPLLSHS